MTAQLAALVAYTHDFLNTLFNASNDLTVALRGQGLHIFNAYTGLSDDAIGDISSNSKKPGGTIANPTYHPANPSPVAGAPSTLPNPGIPIGHLIEKRQNMLRYFCYHLQRIQRPFNIANATLLTFYKCYKLQE
jgi:hypothetical protein